MTKTTTGPGRSACIEFELGRYRVFRDDGIVQSFPDKIEALNYRDDYVSGRISAVSDESEGIYD